MGSIALVEIVASVVRTRASYYSRRVSKNAVRVVISVGLMAMLLAVFFWNVDLDEVRRALGRANPTLIFAAAATALASYWFRAVRWQLILRPVGHVGHLSAVLATAVGYAAMTLLPARMGDLIRPLALSKRERIPFSATLASIFTERLFDLWTVILFFLIFVIWPPEMAALDEQASRNLEILSLQQLGEFLLSCESEEETYQILGACFEVYIEKGCGFTEPVYLGTVIVEIKAVSMLCDNHRSQVLNYLNTTGIQVALLVNFGYHPKLEYERIVNQKKAARR